MTNLTSEKETPFGDLYRTDPDFRQAADIAKRNGWTEDAIVREWLTQRVFEGDEDE